MAPKRRGGAKSFGARDRESRNSGLGSTEKQDEYKPRERYPPTSVPKFVGLRDSEREQIAIFRRMRKAFQDGPLYTVLEPNSTSKSGGSGGTVAGVRTGDGAGGSATGARESAVSSTFATTREVKDVDPFEALPTFSQKYKKPRRPVPQLRASDYNKALFPAELHQHIDSSSTSISHGPGGASGLNKAAAAARAKLTAAEEEELMEQEADEDEIMEEEDDDFEEDEDEDDDYNAENYFSDGKSDGGGGDEGGGGGEDY